MITYLIEHTVDYQFTLEMLLSCLIYVIPVEKREHYKARAIIVALVCVLCSVAMPLPLGEQMTAAALVTSTLIFAVEFILAVFWTWCVCDVSISEAFFCGSCAYATQHFAYALNCLIKVWLEGSWFTQYSFIVVNLAVLVAFYYLFARKLAGDKKYHMERKRVFWAVFIVIIVVFLLSTVSQQIERRYGAESTIDSRLYAMLCCAFALWVQVSIQEQSRLKNEMLLNEQLWHKQKEQYQTTHENIEIINRKCHDLKYQIAALRAVKHEDEREACLDEIEKAIEIYDTSMKTGNEVLDTLLTEKTLYCDAHDINLTCVADGHQMAFMDSTDIYSILGNALDNAIEHVEHIEDKDKRLLAIMIWSRANLLLIQVENYCEQIPEMRDGLPVTTKPNADYHGFGLKSIRYTAEKYGGAMSVQLENNLFIMRVTIPIRQE